MHGRQSPTLDLWQSPDKFTGKRKRQINVYRLHFHEVAVLIYTARLALPYLADKLFCSEEDKDTSGTADTDPNQRQAALTISFLGRKVFLSVESVVAGGGQRRWGRGDNGQSIDPSIHR